MKDLEKVQGIYKKSVTNRAVKENLSKWIKEGVSFSTPFRWCGGGWCVPFYSCSIRGQLYRNGYKYTYVVYSYNTPICRVHLEKVGDTFRGIEAEFDNRKYSSVTNIMQNACDSALRDLFHLPYIPDVIGKRGGVSPRRNNMKVWGGFLTGWEWGVLKENGEIVVLKHPADAYNGDTKGYF